MYIDGLKPYYNFGGLDKEFSEFDNSKYVILPVPYDSTTSYKVGTREGPNAIINASMNMELYDIETSSNPYKAGICTLASVEPDVGNVEQFLKKLEKICSEILKYKKYLITLGGEHSISYSPIAAYYKLYKKLKKKFAVLQIDAHSDLRFEYEGTVYNHACVMRRIREEFKLDTVHIGIRSFCDEEAEYIKKNKVKIFYGHEVSNNLKEYTNKIINELKDYEYVYLTIDVDGFDPSILPATGTPEPGGIFWYETLYFIKELAMKKNIIGFDVVELMPLATSHASDFLVAKLIYKIIAYLEKYAK